MCMCKLIQGTNGLIFIKTECQTDRHQLPRPVLQPGPPEQTLEKANEWKLNVNLWIQSIAFVTTLVQCEQTFGATVD